MPVSIFHPLFTGTCTKALVEVNGDPFLAHQLRLLRANGIERVIICAGHLGELIQEYTGDGSRFGLRVECVFDGPRLLGTAGALKQAVPRLGRAFFVLLGYEQRGVCQRAYRGLR